MLNKFEVNGCEYYFNTDTSTFIDENFMLLPEYLIEEVAYVYFAKVDYKNLDAEQTYRFINSAKKSKANRIVLSVCEDVCEKFSNNNFFIQRILPLYNSASRALGYVKEGIEFVEKYLRRSTESVLLYTSLAASYCDLGDYDRAYRFAKLAYVIQGGGVGYKNELSLVFKRIQKHRPDLADFD